MDNYSLGLKQLFKSQTVRKGSLFTIFSFCSSGISFILLVILARFIDPEGYGFISLFNTIVTILGFVISLNTVGILSVNFFIQGIEDFRKTVAAVSNITCVCFAIISVLLFANYSIIQPLIGLPLKFVFLALIISFANTYTQNLLNIWRIEEKILMYGIYSILFSLGYFTLAIILVVCLEVGWQGQVVALCIVNIIFLIASIVLLIKKEYLRLVKPSRENYEDCLRFGVPLIPHSISGWLRQGLDRILISSFQNIEQVGFFGFSYNFATILIMIGSAFNNTNSVFISKNLASGSEDVREKLRKQTIMIIGLFVVLMLIIWAGAYFFIPNIFPKYIGCRPYLFPMCLGALFQCIYLQFVNFLFFFKKTKVLMYITFSVSVIHALGSYILTQYSIICTVWLGVITNFLITLFVYIYSQRIYRL